MSSQEKSFVFFCSNWIKADCKPVLIETFVRDVPFTSNVDSYDFKDDCDLSGHDFGDDNNIDFSVDADAYDWRSVQNSLLWFIAFSLFVTRCNSSNKDRSSFMVSKISMFAERKISIIVSSEMLSLSVPLYRFASSTFCRNWLILEETTAFEWTIRSTSAWKISRVWIFRSLFLDVDELYLKDKLSRRLWVTFSRTKFELHSIHLCPPLCLTFLTNLPFALCTWLIISVTISVFKDRLGAWEYCFFANDISLR